MDAFELQDELNALMQDSKNYEILNERDFSSEDPTRLLEGLSQKHGFERLLKISQQPQWKQSPT